MIWRFIALSALCLCNSARAEDAIGAPSALGNGNAMMSDYRYRPADDSPVLSWPQTNNLVFAYCFTTDATTDESGNGHTLVTLPTAVTPTYVGAVNGLDYDGINDYSQCGTSTTLMNGLAQATLATWLRRDALGTKSVAAHSNDATVAALRIQLLTSGARALCRGLTSADYATCTVGEWTHVVAVWDTTASPRVKFYRNGAYFAGFSPSGGTLSASTLFILGCLDGTSAFFDGRLDDVAAWSVALTPAEVSQVYLSATH